MGLKATNYTAKNYGITLENAYAQITSASVGLNGKAHCMFEIQTDREAIGVNSPFDTVVFHCEVDKALPVFEQLYTKAKSEIFVDWEDDIVE